MPLSIPETVMKFYSEKIRPDIQTLLDRPEPLESAELEEIRSNSYEYAAMTPHLSDEALIKKVEYCIKNCQPPRHPVPIVYDEAVIHMYVPELIKRLKAKAVLEDSLG